MDLNTYYLLSVSAVYLAPWSRWLELVSEYTRVPASDTIRQALSLQKDCQEGVLTPPVHYEWIAPYA